MALGTPVAAAAAYSAAGGTTVTPAYPAGILTTDSVILFVGQKPSTANGGTVTTPTGWTLRDELTGAGGYGATLGADTGNTNLRVYTWNTPVAGQTGNLTVTLGVNNVSWAFMVRVPTGGGTLSYGSADGQRTTTPTSPMAIALTNGASATAFQSGDLAIWAMCIPTDVTTPAQFSAEAVTATGATFATAVEINEPDSTLGNDIGGYSARASVTAGSSATAPTVTATLAGTLTNVRGPVVLLRVREAPVTQTLTPNLYTNTNTFHNPTVTPGTVALTPALYTNTQVFYSPDVTVAATAQNLAPALYTNTNAFFTQTVTSTRALTPALYTNTNTFFTQTVSASKALTPALYANTNTFFTQTVTASSTLVPALYTNTNVFFTPTVSPGAVALTPALYSNTNVFYSPVVSKEGAALAPALYVNTNAFFTQTVTSTRALTPALYTNTNTFFAQTVATSNTLAPALYANTNTFFTQVVSASKSLAPALYTNTQTFFEAVVAAGNILVPGLYTNTQTFYSPSISQTGPAQLLDCEDYVDPGYVEPDWYVAWSAFNVNAFFSPTAVYVLLYPLPSDVRLGVVYGPDGIYVGTYAPTGGRKTIYVFDD